MADYLGTRIGHFQRTPPTGYDASQPTGDAMKRRSRAGGKTGKAVRRKAPKPKPRNAPQAIPRSKSSSGEETEVVRLTRELGEALARQAATSDVLRVISRSTGDLQPVFEAVLENAVRLSDARFGTINRWDGEALHLVATHKIP